MVKNERKNGDISDSKRFTISIVLNLVATILLTSLILLIPLPINVGVGVNNGESQGQLFSLYECGSNIQYKVIYEFNVQEHSGIFWGPYYGKIIVEQILGDHSKSGVMITYLPADPDFHFTKTTLGDYNARDYIINLLAGEPALLPTE